MFAECLESPGEKVQNTNRDDNCFCELYSTLSSCIVFLNKYEHIHACVNVTEQFICYSYRIERAIAIPLLQSAQLTNKFLMHKRIVHAVDIHRRGVELVFIILMYNKIWIMTIVIITVIIII